ncbi:BC85_0335 family putative methyltransferase [Mycoplasma sp. HS2188]|uniref:BC85_0335 family putative methyltransferase n=1 Tax=Mycoplasma sp. HS2188 TaxID=2976765 RepID=UPI0021AA9DC3|nr:hypothetical protein [Mycoplasma sp. HS2188]MCT4469756.1 hypothetical protein [Mycoplasma sp. HS2188]
MISAKLNLPDWAKWTLFASMFIVAAIGIGAYFWSRWKVRQIKQNLQNEEDRRNRQKLMELRGDDLGMIPYDLKDFFGSKSDDYDVENWVNTVFLNDANDVLFVSPKLEFELATLLLKTKANISIVDKEINANLWNSAVVNFPHYFTKKVRTSSISELKKEQFKLIFASNLTQSNIELFQQFYSILEPKGMLIIRQDSTKNSDLKQLVTDLKITGVLHEVSAIKSKFIYIVKQQNNN